MFYKAATNSRHMSKCLPRKPNLEGGEEVVRLLHHGDMVVDVGGRVDVVWGAGGVARGGGLQVNVASPVQLHGRLAQVSSQKTPRVFVH